MTHEKGLFLFLSCVHISAGLYCLSCTDGISPRHCHSVRKCDEGEVCFTESHLSGNGEVVFDTGCTIQQACQTKRDNYVYMRRVDPHYNHNHCKECCTVDLCNNEGCNEPDKHQTVHG
uniref:Prostate stem cell antigen-like n=1 Tax=Crassostrea virginica TaxID=6565 RepID=A0A8B8BWJ2_CRAVI|nr:prostate stem cell antigen-like [Crassostrea virginica]